MNRKDLSFRAIFRVPLFLFVSSLIGLGGALLADGLWDCLGAAFLGIPLLALVWAVTRGSR